MADDDSVTRWLRPLREGSEEAATEIFRRFYEPLLAKIRARLGRQCRVADEEDVALATLHSLFRRLKTGEFASLADRDGMWSLLIEIATCKSVNQLRDQNRLKRGGGKVAGESFFLRAGSAAELPGLDSFADDEVMPEVALQIAETMDRLFALLDAQGQQIALYRLEGYSDAETAEALGCSKATIERRLKMIRAKWESEVN